VLGVRRIALIGAVLSNLVVVPATTTAAIVESPPGSRPDIVVIMVDDLGAIDNRILDRLPNIKDLFLDRGLAFSSYFGETPLCCPGRAEFLTGEHVRKNGVVKNDARLLDPSQTIATALHDVGYRTAMIGKYLNRSNLLADKTPPGWDHVAMLTAEPDATTSSWYIDDQPLTEGYKDRFTLDDSVAWLKGLNPAKSFFLWATPRAPHFAPGKSLKPWIPAIEPKYVGDARCSGIARWKPPAYNYAKQPDGFPLDDICRSMLTVDEMVGDIEQVMADEGRNPIYVLTSDNGMAWGWDGFPVKNVPEASRMPLFVSGPGIAARTTTALESNIDLGPTLADLGGTTMPWADGVSFASVIAGGNVGRDYMIQDHPLGGYTAGPWRLPWWGILTPKWHYLKIGTRPGVLYNVIKDPWEQTVLFNRTVKQRLKSYWPC